MWVSDEMQMVYLASPKTASKATKESLRPFGFEKRQGHHDYILEHPGPGWTVFTTVRNPWDLWVSWFFYAGRRGLDFGVEWIDRWRDRHDQYYPDPTSLFAAYTTTANEILRYENLEEDLQLLISPELVLPRVNVGPVRKGRDYHDFYDERTRDHVAEVYAIEIARFGYRY
jgi:hypothetical protein